MLNFTKLTVVFSTVLLLLPIRPVFSQQQKKSVSNCYLQTQEGSIVDLSQWCRPKPTPFTSLTQDKQREVLAGLSKEVNEACNQLPGQCESNTELINVMSKVCNTPGHCPDYINEALQTLRSQKNTESRE